MSLEVLLTRDTQTLVVEKPAMQVLETASISIHVLELARQGPPGPPGTAGPAGNAQLVSVGALPISGHSVVAVDTGGLLVVGNCLDTAQRGRITGLVTSAYTAGAAAEVVRSGVAEHSGWAWTAGLPLLVGATGQLVQALPLGATFSQTVAMALTATRIHIDIQSPIAI